MANKKSIKLFSPEIFFLSMGGLGFLKPAPGTWGTLGTLPFVIAYHYFPAPVIFLLPFYLTTFIGAVFMANFVQKKYQVEDASWIVIDEALGFILFAPFILSHSALHYIIAFGLFRLFDAAKIFPVNVIDQRLKNGLGVMLDDIVAGAMAIAVYRFIFLLLT